MKHDTAGNPIYEPIQNCNCGLTGGCEKCNWPWKTDTFELEKNQKKNKYMKITIMKYIYTLKWLFVGFCVGLIIVLIGASVESIANMVSWFGDVV